MDFETSHFTLEEFRKSKLLRGAARVEATRIMLPDPLPQQR
jgi:hypothetical protein